MDDLSTPDASRAERRRYVMALSRGKYKPSERRMRLHLSPGQRCEHSRLRLSVALPRPLEPLELATMLRVLESCTRETPVITMHAGERMAWLDDWTQTLEEALEHVGLVKFETTLMGSIQWEPAKEPF
jgi:hypothetical protein